MKPKEVHSILIEVLEEQIPAPEIDLWPAVQASLVAGDRPTTRQGAEMNLTQVRRALRPAVAIPLALALLLLLLATPQGRSFAQSVLELFTRAGSAPLAVEESQAGAAGTNAAAPTAAPPAPLISVAEAEAQVGFEVGELPSTPQGFEFLGARLYGDYVSMDYMTQGYGHLLIMQSREGYLESDFDQVPAEQVIPVKIGGLDGELAQGSFLVYPGDATARWNPDAAFTRLRWVEDGLWIEIALHGDAHRYLDLERLIDLAESLAIRP
jgi:hypothetical protein